MQQELRKLQGALTGSVKKPQRVVLPESGVPVLLRFSQPSDTLDVNIDPSVGFLLSPVDMEFIRSHAVVNGSTVTVHGEEHLPTFTSFASKLNDLSGSQKFFLGVVIFVLLMGLLPQIVGALIIGAIGYGMYRYYRKNVVEPVEREQQQGYVTAPAPVVTPYGSSVTASTLLTQASKVDQQCPDAYKRAGMTRDAFWEDVQMLMDMKDKHLTPEQRNRARAAQSRVDCVFSVADIDTDERYVW